MSGKNSNHSTQGNYRTSYLQSKKKYSKKDKHFYYSKKKYYLEEKEPSPSKKNYHQEKEKDSPEMEIVYEDEYQGLMYYPKNENYDNIYYYIEKEKNGEYNNFKTKWKTEICRYWEMYGECKFGDSCAFAHGDSELKKRKMTFNYKTKPCKQFFELGYCSYGSRCQFSHKKEDLQKQKNEIGNSSEDEVSYLKIIKEFLSDDNQISHELVKRPRLMTFEKITQSTLEESKNSKLQLYEDIINIKNSNNKNDFKFKLSDDSYHTNVSSDNNNNNDNNENNENNDNNDNKENNDNNDNNNINNNDNNDKECL